LNVKRSRVHSTKRVGVTKIEEGKATAIPFFVVLWLA
jgi:hypothetical protein